MKKISVISGGTSGLGLEIAARLVKSGKNVLALGRSADKISTASIRLKSLPGGSFAAALKCNVGKEEDVNSIVQWLSDEEFSVEYLYNNAGSGLFNPVHKATSALIDRVFEANIKGMILLTSRVLSITPPDEELTIVNIMSTSALYGRAEESIYCAAKWAARGFTESLRTELKGTKRNIIAVYPGGMRTDFWKAPGQNRDTSNFMDPAEVAEKIVNAVSVTDRMFVTDITINRK
ncbi:MAG TPA: SDR family oxidoreductase [Bacteroidales bacterium]|nr:SDR family oxidoreductase [Bacteroidales bacterium]